MSATSTGTAPILTGFPAAAALGQPEAQAALRAWSAGRGKALTKFSEAVLVLMEVTAQLAELEAVPQAVEGGSEDSETLKWREISSKTLSFARENLIEQQLRAIQTLQDLSARGGSLAQEPPFDPLVKTAPTTSAVIARAETGGMESGTSDVESDAPQGDTGGAGVKPPPGLAAPPGLELMSCDNDDLVAPPGLEHLAGKAPAPAPTAKSLPPWRARSTGTRAAANTQPRVAQKNAESDGTAVSWIEAKEVPVDSKAVAAVNCRLCAVIASSSSDEDDEDDWMSCTSD